MATAANQFEVLGEESDNSPFEILGEESTKTPAEQKFESAVGSTAAASVPKPSFMRRGQPEATGTDKTLSPPAYGSDEWYASKIPQPAVDAMSAVKKYAIDPFDKAAQKGSEAGAALAGTFADPAWVKREDNPYRTPAPVVGAAKGVGATAGGMAADPRNWPFMAAGEVGPVLRRLMTGGFAGLTAKGTVESAQYLHANWDRMTPEQRAQYATQTGLSAAIAASAAVHAIKPRVAVGVTPQEVVVRAGVNPLGVGPKVGEWKFNRGGRSAPAPSNGLEPPTLEGNPQPSPTPSPASPNMVSDAVSALAQADQMDVMSARAAAGLPPTPQPPPPAPMPEVTPESVAHIGDMIEKTPQEQRAPAIIQIHQQLADALLQQGKVVGPDGRLEIIDSEKTASRVAQAWINDEVGRRDDAAEEAQKAAEKEVAKPAPKQAAPVQRPTRAQLEQAKGPQFQVVGEEPIGVESGNATELGTAATTGDTGRDGRVHEKNISATPAGDQRDSNAVVPEEHGQVADAGSEPTHEVIREEPAPLQKGDKVSLSDGRPATVEYSSPTMNLVRLKTGDGEKVSVSGAKELGKLRSQSVTSSDGEKLIPSEYGPPKKDHQLEVPPENLGFDHRPAEDLGNKVREATERRLGAVGREVAPGKVGEMKLSDLKVAPHKFQYKLGTDAEGVSTLLKDVKLWNPDLAGMISVWKDPADGKFYIVNGHHRYELAKRLGQKTVNVRHIVASDAVAARAIGAQQNIADGRGTAVDAAKYFRDTGTTPEDLQNKGISLGEATAKNGLALSRLEPGLFSKVVSGDLRQGRATAIGEATSDPAEQKAILSLVERKERSGAKVSDDTLSELIRLVKGAEQTTETTSDLFGSQQITRSLALEKAEISAHIKQQLAKDKKLFGFVAKEGRATELERGGNKIDVDKSKEISTSAAQAEEVYNKLSERGGPISSILDESARRLADGENGGTVKADAYQKVRAEVRQTLGLAEERSVGRSEGTPEPERTPEVAASKPESPVEPTLPGMEQVPAERAEANAEQQGKDLSEKLTEPPKSIERAAGEIEQKSPLFRDTEANPQGNIFGELFKGESGSFEPAKLKDAAAAVGDFLKASTERRTATGLQSGIYDLDPQYQADVLEAVQVMEKVNKELGKGAPAAFEAIYHHLENAAEKLSPVEDHLLDQTVIPIMEDTDAKFERLEELLGRDGTRQIENYVHRVVKGKGGWFDRIIAGSKGSGRGNLLSKSAPQSKGRTMMALELDKPAEQGSLLDKPGDRIVVSIKGGQVTAWRNGTPENLGAIQHTDEGKVFEDKDGNIWTLTQATTKEVEDNTELEYYHNALASALVSNLQVGKALRGAEFVDSFKKSPEFKEIAQEEGHGTPPQGWRGTDLPQLRGYHYAPHVADVLDWYSKRLRNEGPSVFDEVGKFLRTSIFFNPLIHIPNIANHWLVERGAGGMLPTTGGREFLTAATRAINAVTHQNQDFLDALRAGAPLQSQRDAVGNLQKLFFDQLTGGLEKKEDWALKLAKTVGMSPVDLVKEIYKFSGKSTWVTNDILFMQAVYEKVGRGMPLKEALHETARHIPDYRLPVRILNSTAVSKLMSNPTLTMFGGYHYGALKSYVEMAKSALGAVEPPTGSTRAEEAAHGWGLLAWLGLVTFGLYPLLDKLAKKASGDENARVRRSGASTFVDNVSRLAKGERDPVNILESVATPAVHTKTAIEMAANIDLHSGRHIYDPHADWGTIGQQVGRRLMDAVSPVGQAARMYEQKGATKRFLYGLAGVTFPQQGAHKVASEIAQSNMPGKAEEPKARAEYYMRRDILDALRNGDSGPLNKAREQGKITHEEAHELRKRARLDPLADQVNGFTAEDFMRVYNTATPEEKRELDRIRFRKRRTERERGHRAAADALSEVNQ